MGVGQSRLLRLHGSCGSGRGRYACGGTLMGEGGVLAGALVEEGLNARSASHYWDGAELRRLRPELQIFDFDTEAARAARIEKRKALFAEFEKLNWRGPAPTLEDIVNAIREGREERDERMLEAAGFYGECGASKAVGQ